MRCLRLPGALHACHEAISFDIARGGRRRARASRAVVSAETHLSSSCSKPRSSFDLLPANTNTGSARFRRYTPRQHKITATRGLQTLGILISTPGTHRGDTGYTPQKHRKQAVKPLSWNTVTARCHAESALVKDITSPASAGGMEEYLHTFMFIVLRAAWDDGLTTLTGAGSSCFQPVGRMSQARVVTKLNRPRNRPSPLAFSEASGPLTSFLPTHQLIPSIPPGGIALLMKHLTVAIGLAFILATLSSCSRGGDASVTLLKLDAPKATAVVATLDTPIPQGKSAIWCASFLAAWKSLAQDLDKEPVALRESSGLVAALNDAPDPRPAIPPSALYVPTGWSLPLTFVPNPSPARSSSPGSSASRRWPPLSPA